MTQVTACSDFVHRLSVICVTGQDDLRLKGQGRQYKSTLCHNWYISWLGRNIAHCQELPELKFRSLCTMANAVTLLIGRYMNFRCGDEYIVISHSTTQW